jgi:uroporphyrinogen decarboxylase
MLTSKERFQRILRHKPVDRIGLFEVFWKETAEAWAEQGHFEKPEAISDHFALDVRRTGGEITPVPWKAINLVADLDAGNQIIEQTSTAKLIRDGNGALLRWRTDHSGGPEHVDFSVKDRRGWEELIRPHLCDERTYSRRIDFELYRTLRDKCARQNLFMCVSVHGVFDLINKMCGHQYLLMGMATDPDWVREMCDVYATLTINLLEDLLAKEGLPDGLWMWDDLGFKHRPFMAPAMYRELIFPGHKRVFNFAHGRGLPVVLHSDGLVEPLIPHLIEAGIDCLQPLEVKAGMDLLQLKQAYGERIALIGGMDVRELISNDLGRVCRELERKLPPAMAGGGYILQVDHSVPNQVNYDTYTYFVDEGLRIGTYSPQARLGS